ncbi:MAG: 50S ribosomal protein L15 [Candidatus Peribacteraceae bacterium]|nr:50S ribosomal protein L15 [Candidatus Peribacteraceae bacterium]
MVHILKPNVGATHKVHRRARGNASGSGTTAGRGTKGQQSRSGKGRRAGFEGGQTPLIRRQPKLGGFTRPGRIEFEVLNIGTIEKLDAGSYSVNALKKARLVSGKHPVKILGSGEITKKFTLTVHAASKSAKEAVEKAGGSIVIHKA